MTRRLLISLIATAVLATSCSGTGEAPESLGFAQEPTTITVWAWDGVVTPEFIEAFEAENPDVRIDLNTSSFDQHLSLIHI